MARDGQQNWSRDGLHEGTVGPGRPNGDRHRGAQFPNGPALQRCTRLSRSLCRPRLLRGGRGSCRRKR
jgi:hypothetical protein